MNARPSSHGPGMPVLGPSLPEGAHCCGTQGRGLGLQNSSTNCINSNNPLHLQGLLEQLCQAVAVHLQSYHEIFKVHPPTCHMHGSVGTSNSNAQFYAVTKPSLGVMRTSYNVQCLLHNAVGVF